MEFCYILGTITSFILFICGLASLLTFTENIGLNEYDCKISNVTFPTNVPTVNETNMDNFVRCDCGYKCTSDLGTCLNIYGSINDLTTVKNFKKSISNKRDQCTFTETKCRNGDDILNRIDKINEVVERGNYYNNLMTNNETIKCYYSSDSQYIYMEKNVDYTMMTILFSIMLFIIILMIICYYINKRKKNNTNSFV